MKMVATQLMFAIFTK